MIQIISMKKDIDFVLKEAEDRIDELEGHRANALKLGMGGAANEIKKYIEQIRNIKADFNAGVALKFDELIIKIEAEDIQVGKMMASIRDSKRELEESIKSNQRESVISAIKAAPVFIEIMNNSFDENLGKIKEMDEKWQKGKS